MTATKLDLSNFSVSALFLEAYNSKVDGKRLEVKGVQGGWDLQSLLFAYLTREKSPNSASKRRINLRKL